MTFGPATPIEQERLAMSAVNLAPTVDRSNVGVLTEFQGLLHDLLDDDPELPLHEHSVRLAQTPIVARKLFPADATCRLFGVAVSRHPW